MKFLFSIALISIVASGILFSHYASAEQEIPSWIKKIITLWAEGQISDTEFTNAMEYLIENNIIKISGISLNSQIQKQLDYLEAKNEVNQEELQTLRTENEEYRIEILTLKEQKMMPKDATGYLSEENKRLQSEVNSLRAENKGIQNIMNSLTAENENYKSQLSFLSAENAEFKNKINSLAVSDQSKEEVKKLELEISNYQDQLKSLQAENMEYKNKVNSLVADKTSKDTINKLKLDVDKYQNEIKTLRDKNVEYKNKMDSLVSDTKLKDEADTLRVQIVEYETEIKSIKDENTQYQSKLESIVDENTQYKNKLKAVLSENADYKDKLNTVLSENADYKNKINSAASNKGSQSKLELLKTEISKYEEKIKVLKDENDEYKTKLDTILTGSTESQNELGYLRAKNQVNQDELQILRAENEEYRIKLNLNAKENFKATFQLKKLSSNELTELHDATKKQNKVGAYMDTSDIQEKPKSTSHVIINSGITNYNVYVQPLPQWALYGKDSVNDAINFWQDATGIKFSKVETADNANIIVKWVKEASGNYDAYTMNQKYVDVSVGNTECDGTWHSFDSESISTLLMHEFGHALGLSHSSDQNNIMFPVIHKARYAPVKEEYTVKANQALFIGGCTARDETPYVYHISMDDSTHGFDVFVVPSKSQYDNFLKGEKFQYYSDDGCYAINRHDYTATCNGVANTGGLLVIMPNKLEHDTAKLNVLIQEK